LSEAKNPYNLFFTGEGSQYSVSPLQFVPAKKATRTLMPRFY